MTAPTATATTLMTPETNANPYPEYHRLRAQSPIYFGQEAGSSAGGLWATDGHRGRAGIHHAASGAHRSVRRPRRLDHCGRLG